MSFDPNNLVFSPDVVRELRDHYDTYVVFHDYFIDMNLDEGRITGQFYRRFMSALEKVEPGERWTARSLGCDPEGWEQIEQVLYYGPRNTYNPNAPHMIIRLKFKPKGIWRRTKREGGCPGRTFGELLEDVMTGLAAIFVVDSITPPQKGQGTFLRDTAVAYAAITVSKNGRESNRARVQEGLQDLRYEMELMDEPSLMEVSWLAKRNFLLYVMDIIPGVRDAQGSLVDRSEGLYEKHCVAIEEYLCSINWDATVDQVTTRCLDDIVQKEGHPEYTSEFYSDHAKELADVERTPDPPIIDGNGWAFRSDIPDAYRGLRDKIDERVIEHFNERMPALKVEGRDEFLARHRSFLETSFKDALQKVRVNEREQTLDEKALDCQAGKWVKRLVEEEGCVFPDREQLEEIERFDLDVHEAVSYERIDNPMDPRFDYMPLQRLWGGDFKCLKTELKRRFERYRLAQRAKRWSDGDFRDASSFEFALWVGDVMRKNGWSNVSGTPADPGELVDLMVEKEGKNIAVQARRNQKPIGEAEVREFVSALKTTSVAMGYILTNVTLTGAAQKYAEENGVQWMDGSRIYEAHKAFWTQPGYRCDCCASDAVVVIKAASNAKVYAWCEREDCETLANETVPVDLRLSYRGRYRDIPSLVTEDVPNLIEVVYHGGIDPIIRGEAAKKCQAHWTKAANESLHNRLYSLYDHLPKSRFLVFDENGGFIYKTHVREDAIAQADEDKVLVFWGGR